MTNAEFNKLLRKARTVSVWVTYSTHDGCYVRVSKAAIREALPDDASVVEFCKLREDGDLYIN